MQRLSLALAVTAITLCWGTVTRAQVGFPVCQPLPPWYPRGWELMLRYPCVTYVYGSPYYASDPPPLKWSDLRYVFDIKEDCNGKEAIQA